MGKPEWWRSAITIIRAYPMLEQELREKQRQHITADYDRVQSCAVGQTNRSTENAALHTLNEAEMKAYDAVRSVLESTDESTRKLVRWVHWERACTLSCAAGRLFVCERTAKRLNSTFVHAVARRYGFDKEEAEREKIRETEKVKKEISDISLRKYGEAQEKTVKS